ncbi:MAG: hypothetical protein HY788_12315 [Deltaproteobacteria bacterium]|nr:hypothetical protein [Deltaproteobacteria bacterium]
MRILDRLYKKGRKQTDVEEMLGQARAIGSLVDKVVNKVLERHFETLLQQSIVYLVTGVWGASKEGKIDPIQEEIHREVETSLTEILAALDLDRLREAQKYSILFVIRELIVSRIGYALERFKSSAGGGPDESASMLDEIKPLGEA